MGGAPDLLQLWTLLDDVAFGPALLGLRPTGLDQFVFSAVVRQHEVQQRHLRLRSSPLHQTHPFQVLVVQVKWRFKRTCRVLEVVVERPHEGFLRLQNLYWLVLFVPGLWFGVWHFVKLFYRLLNVVQKLRQVNILIWTVLRLDVLRDNWRRNVWEVLEIEWVHEILEISLWLNHLIRRLRCTLILINEYGRFNLNILNMLCNLFIFLKWLRGCEILLLFLNGLQIRPLSPQVWIPLGILTAHLEMEYNL